MVALTSFKALLSLPGVSEEGRPSPLDALHRELGAQMVPFGGWEMPIRYRSIIEEHEAVRSRAGVFDISHMGELRIRGAGAAAWLDRMLTNHVAGLEVGTGHYTFLLNDDGGVIDDLILYRVGDEEFFAVVNAAKVAEDVDWLRERIEEGVELDDRSEEFAAMAVQGPEAAAVYAAMTDGASLPERNGIEEHDGGRWLVCRTGYTGEDGFEFFCPAADGADWFRKAMAAGAVPCGLGARDTLRLEVCYPLNGSDLSPDRSPLEAGLGFFVALEKGEFTGREVLAAQKEEGLAERLAAIRCVAKGPPVRAGAPVLGADGEQLGVLTSGTLSPSLGIGIGMAYLPRRAAKPGTPVTIDVRGRPIAAEVVKKPFYKPR
ncbi:MAG: glycine cleavage system aminomethyltransferase GcvT [Akkermansiaceae bacterium]|nr:glycine cleavage system aminomethyltransferase GcvT [Akkermansiaceae bacterium]NNM30783.1 glycine cleavage system aminomethyltransferase GcvT [Akkermansiaceae bacterium]